MAPTPTIIARRRRGIGTRPADILEDRLEPGQGAAELPGGRKLVLGDGQAYDRFNVGAGMAGQERTVNAPVHQGAVGRTNRFGRVGLGEIAPEARTAAQDLSRGGTTNVNVKDLGGNQFVAGTPYMNQRSTSPKPAPVGLAAAMANDARDSYIGPRESFRETAGDRAQGTIRDPHFLREQNARRGFGTIGLKRALEKRDAMAEAEATRATGLGIAQARAEAQEDKAGAVSRISAANAKELAKLGIASAQDIARLQGEYAEKRADDRARGLGNQLDSYLEGFETGNKEFDAGAVREQKRLDSNAAAFRQGFSTYMTGLVNSGYTGKAGSFKGRDAGKNTKADFNWEQYTGLPSTLAPHNTGKPLSPAVLQEAIDAGSLTPEQAEVIWIGMGWPPPK